MELGLGIGKGMGFKGSSRVGRRTGIGSELGVRIGKGGGVGVRVRERG